MYRALVIILSIVVVFSSKGYADYEGHYIVTKPEISIEDLERQANGNASNKPKIATPIKKQQVKKNIITDKEKSLMKQNQELANRLQELEELKKKEELARLKELDRLKEEQRLKELKEELERLKQLAKEQAKKNQDDELPEFESLKGEVYEDENKAPIPIKRAKEFTGFQKSVASMPVDRTRIITNDSYIVGLLKDSIDTELGGRVIIIVESDILGAEGYKILIPKGSHIICTYAPLTKEGNGRLNMLCNRILTPDGVSVALINSYVADEMGRTGAIGQVDNRNWEKYGKAGMLSLVNGINSYATFALAMSNNANVVSFAPVMSSTSNQLTTATNKILDKSINLAPIVTIAQGSRVILIPQTDIYFPDPNATNTKDDTK